ALKRQAALFVTLALALGFNASSPKATSAQTLQGVKARGSLNCGVSEGIAGFSAPDPKGMWSGFDVDFCRAIAAAIFNDPSKVSFIPLSTTDRFAALKSGKIDVLSRNSTWTMSRETELALNFAAVTYYDGQGFMVRRALNVASAYDFGDVKACVQTGTTTELNLADHFQTNSLKYTPVKFTSVDEMVNAYDSARCDVLTTDTSQLYALRLRLMNPSDHLILPDVISKEPLGPATRRG